MKNQPAAPNRQRKAFAACHVKALDEEQGIVEAFVSVFGVVDYAKERVMPGFFTKSLAVKLPKGVWAHDWTVPVAKTLAAEEILAGDSRLPDEIKAYGGLYVKGQFNLDTQRGREAFSDLKFGTVDEFSFGYCVTKSRFNSKDGCTDLIEGEIYEWSPVLVGCNPATVLVGVKMADGKTDTKGQYLGEYAEASATFAAIYDAWRSICYGPLYDAVYDWDDQPLADRQATVAGALEEFRDFCVRVFGALITEDGDADAAMAEVKSLWPVLATKDVSGSLRAGAPFGKQLDTALAAVGSCVERGEQLKELRAKDDRPLSEARREQLTGLKDRIAALLELPAPKAAPAEIREAEINHLRRKARQRELVIGVTE